MGVEGFCSHYKIINALTWIIQKGLVAYKNHFTHLLLILVNYTDGRIALHREIRLQVAGTWPSKEVLAAGGIPGEVGGF